MRLGTRGRRLSRVLAGVAVAAVVSTTASVALADPPSGVTPRPVDIVGVGADVTASLLDQLSHDYNAGLASAAAHLYSWDATNPSTGAIGDQIVTKSGCKAIPRPDGSSEGVSALTTENGTTSGHPCIDFARSSSDRSTSTPPYGKGGVAFIDLAGDAVTYATQPGSDAPGNLTTADLTAIYECKVTNWDQVGGKNGPIHAFIPFPGSGTRSFFLTAIGVTTPGSCVSDDNGDLVQSEGVNPVLNKDKPDVIVPYSVGQYVAERYHSAACLNSGCTAEKGVICKPKSGQNAFGCDTRGTMVLNEINGTAPTKPWPLTNSTTNPVINPSYTSTFSRLLFDVVPYSTASGNVNHIAPNLAAIFGPKGYVCTNSTAIKDLKNYGFEVLPPATGNQAGDCGSTH